MAEEITVNVTDRVDELTVNVDAKVDSIKVELREVEVGPSGTLTIGEVTTLGPDDEAFVENVGTPSGAILKIGIPKGDQGEPGVNGLGFEYTQVSPSSTWLIAHNLGFRPFVNAVTVGGVEMVGSVTNLSENVLQINFNVAVAGKARLI